MLFVALRRSLNHAAPKPGAKQLNGMMSNQRADTSDAPATKGPVKDKLPFLPSQTDGLPTERCLRSYRTMVRAHALEEQLIKMSTTGESCFLGVVWSKTNSFALPCSKTNCGRPTFLMTQPGPQYGERPTRKQRSRCCRCSSDT
jgi:hypothetical protein